MSKKIAVEGDVQATPGTRPFPPANSGTWTEGPVTETACTNIASGGKKGLFSATCTFSFTGTQSTPGGPVVVSGSETVALKATATALTSKGKALLLDGEAATDKFGNKLEVNASQQNLTSS